MLALIWTLISGIHAANPATFAGVETPPTLVSNAARSAITNAPLVQVATNLPELTLRASPLQPDGRIDLRLTGSVRTNVFIKESIDLRQWVPAHYDTLQATGLSISLNQKNGDHEVFFRAETGESDLVLNTPPALEGRPFSLLRLTGQGFNPAADTTVRYITDNGVSFVVPVVDLTNGALTAPLPLLNRASGIASLPLKVQIVQKSSGKTRISRTLAGPILKAPASLPVKAGAVTLSVLRTIQKAIALNKPQITGTTWDTAQVQTSVEADNLAVSSLIASIEALQTNASSNIPFGSIDGKEMIITTANLQATDELLVSWLEAFAKAGALPLSEPHQVTALMLDCQSTAAQEAATAAAGGQAELERFLLPVYTSRQAGGCAPAEAFSTAMLVAGGSAGLALGAPLLAFGSAAVAAVAPATAALLAATIELSAGQIALGAALSQTTTGAQQHVEDGLKRLEELKWGALKAVLPARVTGLASIVLGGSALKTALAQAPVRRQFTLTIVNDGNGGGTISADPPGPVYLEGTSVKLTASTNATSAFVGWTAPCSGTNVCWIQVTSDMTIRASFQKVVFKCSECYPEYQAAEDASLRQYEAESAACNTGSALEQLQCVNAAIKRWQTRGEVNSAAFQKCLESCVR